MLISEAIYDLIWSRSPKFDPGDEKLSVTGRDAPLTLKSYRHPFYLLISMEKLEQYSDMPFGEQ